MVYHVDGENIIIISEFCCYLIATFFSPSKDVINFEIIWGKKFKHSSRSSCLKAKYGIRTHDPQSESL